MWLWPGNRRSGRGLGELSCYHFTWTETAITFTWISKALNQRCFAVKNQLYVFGIDIAERCHIFEKHNYVNDRKDSVCLSVCQSVCHNTCDEMVQLSTTILGEVNTLHKNLRNQC